MLVLFSSYRSMLKENFNLSPIVFVLVFMLELQFIVIYVIKLICFPLVYSIYLAINAKCCRGRVCPGRCKKDEAISNWQDIELDEFDVNKNALDLGDGKYSY